MNWKKKFLLSSKYYPGIKHEHYFGENPNPADEDYERYLTELEYWKKLEEEYMKYEKSEATFELLKIEKISDNNYNITFKFTYLNRKPRIYKAFGYSHGWKFENGYIEWKLHGKEAYKIKGAIKKYSDETILLK